MSQIWRKSNWKTSYVIKLYADGVGAPEVDGDAVLVRNHYLAICRFDSSESVRYPSTALIL